MASYVWQANYRAPSPPGVASPAPDSKGVCAPSRFAQSSPSAFSIMGVATPARFAGVADPASDLALRPASSPLASPLEPGKPGKSGVAPPGAPLTSPPGATGVSEPA